LLSVFVIEELIDFDTRDRRTFAVCASEAVANEYLNTHNGNQLVMLSDGSIVPEYIVNEYYVLHHANDCDPIEE
jgi:hypothetical protein